MCVWVDNFDLVVPIAAGKGRFSCAEATIVLTQAEFCHSFSIPPVATMVPNLNQLIESLSFSEREKAAPQKVKFIPNEVIYTIGKGNIMQLIN